METQFLSRQPKIDTSRQILRLLFQVSAVFARAQDQVVFEVNRAGELVRQSKLLQRYTVTIDGLGQVAKMFSYQVAQSSEVRSKAESVATVDGVRVMVQVTSSTDIQDQLLYQFSETVAQQIAVYVARTKVAAHNVSLERQIQSAQEEIALRKTVDRAKSLLIARKGFSPQRAQEFLETASASAGKPLLAFADEVIIALSNPHLFVPEKSRRTHKPGSPIRCA